jgi:hypothetical protein
MGGTPTMDGCAAMGGTPTMDGCAAMGGTPTMDGCAAMGLGEAFALSEMQAGMT